MGKIYFIFQDFVLRKEILRADLESSREFNFSAPF